MFKDNLVDDVLFMTAPNIETKHAFTTRFGGASDGIYKSMNLGLSVGDDRQTVFENYSRLCEAIEITTDELVFSRQVHGADVSVVTRSDTGSLRNQTTRQADGLITNESNVALMVFAADCVPILLHDPIKAAIGAIHAGWRGTAANIVGIAIKKMETTFGSLPGNIQAAIGPCISNCCFETDYDVVSALILTLGENADKCYYSDSGKYMVDLKKANTLLIKHAGVNNISVSDECTSCNSDKYWSHRKTKGRRGSQAAVIVNRKELAFS